MKPEPPRTASRLNYYNQLTFACKGGLRDKGLLPTGAMLGNQEPQMRIFPATEAANPPLLWYAGKGLPRSRIHCMTVPLASGCRIPQSLKQPLAGSHPRDACTRPRRTLWARGRRSVAHPGSSDNGQAGRVAAPVIHASQPHRISADSREPVVPGLSIQDRNLSAYTH